MNRLIKAILTFFKFFHLLSKPTSVTLNPLVDSRLTFPRCAAVSLTYQTVGHNWVTELNWTEPGLKVDLPSSTYNQNYGFSSSHVWMWELDHREGSVLKNWWFWTVVLGKTLESPLDCKEMKPVNTKGNQSWIFIGRTDAEAETPIRWPPDEKSWLIRKDPDAGKDWRQEEKGLTEDEIVGWHHWLNGHEFEQALGDGEEQGSSELFGS